MSGSNASASDEQSSWQTIAWGPWYLIAMGPLSVAGFVVSAPIISFRYGAIGSPSFADQLVMPMIFGLAAGLFWVVFVTPRVRVGGVTLKVVNPFLVWEVPAREITGFRTAVGLQIDVATNQKISVAACPQSPFAAVSGNRYGRRVADRLDRWREGVVATQNVGSAAAITTGAARRNLRWASLVPVLIMCAVVVASSLTAHWIAA